MNHLLFTEDLKLYAKNEGDLEVLLNLVKVCSKDIEMEFGLVMCGMVTLGGEVWNGNVR